MNAEWAEDKRMFILLTLIWFVIQCDAKSILLIFERPCNNIWYVMASGSLLIGLFGIVSGKESDTWGAAMSDFS